LKVSGGGKDSMFRTAAVLSYVASGTKISVYGVPKPKRRSERDCLQREKTFPTLEHPCQTL